jgi:hypothetical protein
LLTVGIDKHVENKILQTISSVRSIAWWRVREQTLGLMVSVKPTVSRLFINVFYEDIIDVIVPFEDLAHRVKPCNVLVVTPAMLLASRRAHQPFFAVHRRS